MQVFILDGIFNGDDVPCGAAIDLLDERGQRRRFAGAGRSADEHQASR